MTSPVLLDAIEINFIIIIIIKLHINLKVDNLRL